MNSDFTQFSSNGPGAVSRTQPVSSEGQKASLIGVPNELREVREPTRLRGEVVHQNEDSSIRVRTERGEVDLRLRTDESPPRQGQPVELTIHPGQPPDTATIRPTPQERTEPAPHPPAPDLNRPSSTPVNVQLESYQAQISRLLPQTKSSAPSEIIPPAIFESGALIRLQPIPQPELPVLLAQNLPEIIATTITETTAFTAHIITQDAQNLILTETINISAHPPETFLKIISPTEPNILNTFQTQQAPLPVITFNQVASQTPTLSVPPSVLILPTQPQALQPVIINPEVPITSPEAAALSVKIETLQTQQVQIAPPSSEGTLQVAETNIKPDPFIIQEHKAGSLSGIVVGTTKEQLPIITVFPPTSSIGQSFIALAPTEGIITSTPLQITPQTPLVQPVETPGTRTPLPPFSYFLTPESWPAMEELYQNLTHTAPPLAQALTNVTPSPANPAQLGPALLFFIAAIRSGDLASWLGDKTADALRRDGRGNILTRLTQEGGLLNRLAAEPVSQDWRAVALPMFWEGQIQKVALYYKRDDQGGEENDQSNKPVRFIFDLNLDRMGKVQLDGLFRTTRLDLIVRTEESFSQAMQMDMKQAYTTAISQSELEGELSFQNSPEQWVTIQVEQEKFGTSA